ncbi:MAG: response regulator [Rhodobacteraceae bacterium]|jgi:DNA-binding response OmpR family regulator|nr:response regulator [Paracoccaceae bacterium]
MPEVIDFVSLSPLPTPDRPLLGLTVLIVEDSRFASEALRMMAVRSGARIRRADSLAAARRHLRVYRPAAVVVDLGLPDGSGLDLIADLAGQVPRIEVLLATSGDEGMAEAARNAGADGFLVKPLTRLAQFQQAVLSRLPQERHPPGPRLISDERIVPDPLALRDDLVLASDLLGDRDHPRQAYAAQFVATVAQCAGDPSLAEAAAAASRGEAGTFDRLAVMVQDRLAAPRAAI